MQVPNIYISHTDADLDCMNGAIGYSLESAVRARFLFQEGAHHDVR